MTTEHDDRMTGTDLTEPESSNRTREAQRREWIWLVVTTGGLLLVYLSPLRYYLTHLQDLHREILRLGPVAPLMFIVISALMVALGFPRMPVYPLAGAAFGIKLGLFCGLIGTLGGCYAAFVYARWAGKDGIEKRWPGVHRITSVFNQRSVIAIALARQLPSPAFVTNLFFGISNVTHFAFLVGSALGFLPTLIPATMIGSSTIQPSAHGSMWYLMVSLLFIVALWLVFGVYFRFRTRPMKDAH